MQQLLIVARGTGAMQAAHVLENLIFVAEVLRELVESLCERYVAR